jgi:hypothetical protein
METDNKRKSPEKPQSSEDDVKHQPDIQHNLNRKFLHINLQITMRSWFLTPLT